MGQAIHTLRQVHDHAHVMLDDQQGDAHLGIGAAQAVDEAVDQGRVDTGGRLVEKQDLRFIHQRHGKFQQLLLPERQVAGRQEAFLVEANEVEQPFRPLGGIGSDFREHLGYGYIPLWDGDLHVVHAVHLAVDPRLLKRAQHSTPGDLLHPKVGDFPPFELDRALVDRMVANDRIEQCRLARAIGTDKPGDLAFGNGDADVVVGRHVIIGSGSVILPGVTLGDGVAIGALSLVSKDCDPFGVYRGNRRIGERKNDLLQLEEQLKLSNVVDR